MTSLKINALKYKPKKSMRIHVLTENPKKKDFFFISAGNVLPQKNPFVIEKIIEVQLSRGKYQSFVI